MRFKIVLLLLFAVTTANKVTYNNYKVFQTNSRSSGQIQFLEDLIKSEDGYSIWNNEEASWWKKSVMVAPTKLDEFLRTMNAKDIELKLVHEDVQKLIDREIKRVKRSDGESEFTWTQYHTLDEIYAWLESLPKKYPGTVKTINGGRTYEGRTIQGIHISFKKNNPGIFIKSGIHAREWIAPATTTYIINEFLTSNESSMRHLAASYDWYIFPSFNPDGYIYSHTTNRLWRKNRSPKSAGCYGVDLNRNWDIMWMKKINASDDPCNNYYGGESAFSEVETKTTSQFIKSIGYKLFAFISFHSPATKLLVPYGYTSEHLDNYNEISSIGEKVVNALSQRYGTKYKFWTFYEALYPASGASIDWVKATLKLPIVIMYEFRSLADLQLLPPEQIIPNSQEVLDSLIVMFEEARKLGYPKP